MYYKGKKKMNIKMLKAAFASLALFVSGFANAGLIFGDFRTESNLPEYRTGSALVYQNIGQSIAPGYELDNSDFLENPDNWGGGVVWLDYDVNTGILLLDSQDNMDFQTFSASISNITFDIAGEYIDGISMLTNNLVTSNLAPTLSFTNDSIQVFYSDYLDFNFTGGSATFQITTSVKQVSEPSTLVIFALGIMGLASRRFKKQ
jgi:hypothetical protein